MISLLDEISGLKVLDVTNSSEVLAQVEVLVVLFEISGDHGEGHEDEAQEESGIKSHLRLNMGRVLKTVTLAKEVVLVEGAQEEISFGWHSESVELVFVIAKTNGSLSESTLGSLRQVRAIDLGGSEQLNSLKIVSSHLVLVFFHHGAESRLLKVSQHIFY